MVSRHMFFWLALSNLISAVVLLFGWNLVLVPVFGVSQLPPLVAVFVVQGLYFLSVEKEMDTFEQFRRALERQVFALLLIWALWTFL